MFVGAIIGEVATSDKGGRDGPAAATS